MTRIVHLIGTLGQFDASVSLRLLAESQRAAGHDVRLILFSPSSHSRVLIEQMKLPSQVVRKRWGYDPFAAWQLVEALRESRPDVVHLWGRRATDAAFTIRRGVPEARLIATLAEVPQVKNPWWPNKSLDAVDAIVTEQEAIRAEFVDAGQGAAKVRAIPPAVVSVDKEIHTRRELLLYLGLPSESRIITIAGPLERSHLVDEAIWCFELVRILHDGAALVIVGEGPERGRLERFARQVTDPHVVRFVPDAELLADVLPYTEIYWQPGVSRWIPSSLLSALAHGLPAIVADVPTHRAVIESEENGLLVPPAKRAVWARQTDLLMRDARLRARLGQAGRQTVVAKFSPSRLCAAYSQLILQSAPAPPLAGKVD
jgi:glycosyltransferase involved in cell wall biosynthesis